MATMNATNIAFLVGTGLVLAVLGGVMSKHIVDLLTRAKKETGIGHARTIRINVA